MTEWDAAEYSRRSGLQEAMAQEVLALLNLKGSERVLDVGCGDGKITAEIAARVPRGSVVGVDASQDMISFASSHFGPTARPNLRFEVADARLLPSGTSSVSWSLSMRSTGFPSRMRRSAPYARR
jgi:trans-aconitate 2-methyltransferase